MEGKGGGVNFDDYTKQAMRSLAPVDVLRGDRATVHLTIELLIAVGFVADLLKRKLIYGKNVDSGVAYDAVRLVRDDATILLNALAGAPGAEEDLKLHPGLTHAALGGYGEEAELLDALLDGAEDGAIDTVNVIEEAGDGLWYTALKLEAVKELTDLSPAEVAARNIAKLMVRFPDKFTLAASEARNVAAEYVVLSVQEDCGSHPD